jgi:regulatory protein
MMEQGTVTGLEVQKRNKKRVRVFLDGEYAFSLSLDDAARLRKGQILSEAEINALRDQDAITRATDAAARFLGLRPRSVQEVRQNLARKDLPPPVIDQAIERLTMLGYLDDRSFAAFWVADRGQFKPLSPRALRYELRRKGIADTIIDEVLADLDAEDAAYRAASSQLRRMRGLDRRTFREKIGVFLGRRGFSYAMSRDTVRRLIETLEEEDPEFFASETDSQDWYEQE